jgi:hypothetical protein
LSAYEPARAKSKKVFWIDSAHDGQKSPTECNEQRNPKSKATFGFCVLNFGVPVPKGDKPAFAPLRGSSGLSLTDAAELLTLVSDFDCAQVKNKEVELPQNQGTGERFQEEFPWAVIPLPWLSAAKKCAFSKSYKYLISCVITTIRYKLIL